MKKNLMIVVAVLVLAVGGFAAYSLTKSKKTYTAENLLPAKPAFYLRTKNLSQRMDGFSKTKLFQELKSIDYQKSSAALGITSSALTQVQSYVENVFSDENIKGFKALFGNDVTVAVYTDDSKDAKTTDKQDLEEVFSNIFIVTQLSAEAAAAETLSKYLEHFNKDITKSVEHYNGKDIDLIEVAEGKVAIGYVRFGNVLVMGVGPKAARAAIDVAASKQKALGSDEDYSKRLKIAYDGTQTFGYFNIKTFYPLLTDEIARLAQSDKDSALYKAQLEEQLKQIQGLDALVFSSKPSLREPNGGEVVTFKADLLYDKAALNPEVKDYYSCPPQENASAKFVPTDAMTYQWNACIDFTQVWKQYKEQVVLQGRALGQEIDVNKAVGVYEQMLGLSIDRDVLPVLGKEFGLYLTDVELSGTFPLPKLVLFIDTTSRAGADALINKLLALQPSLQFEETKYADETIRFIPIPIAEGLALSTVYVGNTLLLSTSVDTLKASLDALKDPNKSIKSNTALRFADGPKNSVFFLQVDRLIQKTEKLIDWMGQSAKQGQIQRQAFITGSKKNLDDIHARDEQLKTKIVANQDVEAAQKELAANEEKIKNLTEQIDFYENKTPKGDYNEQSIDQFVKPLLKALENIKTFSIKTVNGDGVLGSTVQINLQ